MSGLSCVADAAFINETGAPCVYLVAIARS
jgi:hypothetical protein